MLGSLSTDVVLQTPLPNYYGEDETHSVQPIKN